MSLKKNWSLTLGWIITVGWGVFIWYLVSNKSFPDELNSIGDFLAGVFSPLAFLWLIVSYYQSQKAVSIQAEELNQNTKALADQVEEMRKTAEIQHLQLEEMRQQYKNLRSSEKIQLQPFILMKLARKYEMFGTQIEIMLKFEINCINGSARKLFLNFSEHNTVESPHIEYITKDMKSELSVTVATTSIENLNNSNLDLIYYDINNSLVKQRFKFFSNQEDGTKVMFDEFILEFSESEDL